MLIFPIQGITIKIRKSKRELIMKRNRYLNRLLSHRYLFQLAGTCVVFLLLPCLLTLFSAIHHSYRALADTTAEFYLHTTESFASYFRSELGVLRNHALQFSTDSRNPKKRLPF